MVACVRASDTSTKHAPAESAKTRVDQLSHGDSAGKGWRIHFESLRSRRATILAYIFIFHIHQPLKDHYLSKYGPFVLGSGGQVSGRKISRNQVPSSGATSAAAAAAAGESVAELTAHQAWHWRAFPELWRALVWYRRATTIYMAYVVLKNLYPPLLEAPLSYLLLNPSKPIKCYLVGRYLPNIYVRRAAASLFAGYHLIWRYYQLYQPRANYMISTIYFLLLDDRDIDSYYRLLSRARSAKVATKSKFWRVCSRLSKRNEEMLHDTMSARINWCNKMTFKLRPNRTPEASKLLRKHLIDSTLIWLAIFVALATTITLIIYYCVFDSQRYFEDYPGCSPALQLLHDQGQLNGWHLHLRWHQLLAQVIDFLENFILWFESGLAGVFSIPLTMWLNYDLVLYWEYLDDKVAKSLQSTRENYYQLIEGARGHEKADCMCHNDNRSRSGKLTRLNRNETLNNQIHELQMEWQDFIKQIKHSDAFIGDAISTFILVWFTLFGLFVYDSISVGKSNLPLILNMVLLWLVTVVTHNCAALLVLHRHCLKSYTKLCSLMAYDRSVHQKNFIQIVEYFTTKQTCYTLCRGHKLTATTCLTIIGWSFSCFFILGNMRRNYYN